MKKLLFFIIILLGIFFLFEYNDMAVNLAGKVISAIPKEQSQNTANDAVEQTKDIKVFFCPKDDCAKQAMSLLETAKSTMHCSLYDLNIAEMYALLQEKQKTIDVKIVVDNDNSITSPFVRIDTTNGLMHNKFCVVDKQAFFTGSFNPTLNDNEKNNNNLLIIHSKGLAKNYETEFLEQWNGIFGKGEKNTLTSFSLNGTRVENYFCPEDACTNHVLENLASAKNTIHFMAFSFTSNAIGDELVKKYSEGITVKGVMEKKQHNAFDEFAKLEHATIPVVWDTNKYNMHHKVFIIDSETVITGSFNPTKNGEMNNDENILIIHDKEIAQQYEEEFGRVYPK